MHLLHLERSLNYTLNGLYSSVSGSKTVLSSSGPHLGLDVCLMTRMLSVMSSLIKSFMGSFLKAENTKSSNSAIMAKLMKL